MNVALDQIDTPAHLLREQSPDVSDLLPSVTALGVLQPILLRPSSIFGRYDLIAGKRRLTAAQRLGHKTIPAEIRDDFSESQARSAELIENLARRDLPAHREAEGTVELIRLRFEDAGMEMPSDEIKKLLWKLSNEQRGNVPKSMDDVSTEIILGTFTAIGRSFGGFVVGTLPAMNWPPDVREAMDAGMPRSSGQKLAQIKDDTLRKEAVSRVQAGEKAAAVKADVLGGAAQHRALESDLTVAERLDRWPRTESGALKADVPLHYPEPSWSEVVPRTLMIDELLARTVRPGDTIAMINCDLEDVLSALGVGVNVMSVNAHTRFDGEDDELEAGYDLTVLHHRPGRLSEYGEEGDTSPAALKAFQHLEGNKALLISPADLLDVGLPASSGGLFVAASGTAQSTKALLVIHE